MLFRQIEYFQAVIETGNFYQAAEKCNVSQSAISQQIKKLEKELGVKLQCGQFTVNLRKIVRFYPNYIL